jgi:hypothetical protein
LFSYSPSSLSQKKESGSDRNTDDTDAADKTGSLRELFMFFREIWRFPKQLKNGKYETSGCHVEERNILTPVFKTFLQRKTPPSGCPRRMA